MSIKCLESYFNEDWLFSLGDLEAGESVSMNDSQWRQLNVPHDWSIESSFDQENCEGNTGYLPGGIAWYRKHCISPETIESAKVYLNFDGIYNHSKVYVNGVLVSDRPYGYVPITVEISEQMNPAGEDNIIAVRVDHSRYVDSRWYSGSGIYRDVKLMVVDPIHIPIDGTYVTTPVISDAEAMVSIDVTVRNAYDEKCRAKLIHRVMTAENTQVAEVAETIELKAENDTVVSSSINVLKPVLWNTYAPVLYKVMTDVIVDGNVIQTYTTSFAFRTIEFDADKGFFLNGVNTLIKGVCLHHAGGLVGAAVPAGVWRRRFQKLIDGGCNAIRSAHNPPSREFLDLCDEMGILVQNEFYDEWDYPKDKRCNGNEEHDDYISRGSAEFFQEWAEKDLKDVMLRDRNHPCVIQWSIGNEIEWTYHENKKITGYFDADVGGNYFWDLPPHDAATIRDNYNKIDKGDYQIGETAQKLSDWTKELDVTRPVIQNCILPSASYETGVADALDIIGYSYRRVMYDRGHERMPKLPIMGTENLGQWHEWKAIEERPFICGTFLWTGIDYLGESYNQWPVKATGSGLLDGAGFDKGSYHMMKTLWSDQAHVYMMMNLVDASIYEQLEDGSWHDKTNGGWGHRLWQWPKADRHWNYGKGEQIIVEAYSNCEAAELFLNGKSLGVNVLAENEDHIMKWLVPFEEGKLEIKAMTESVIIAEDVLDTAGSINGIMLEIDATEIVADNRDVAHIVTQFVDQVGHPVFTEDEKVTFEIEGPCRLLGVDNGSNSSVQDYQASSVVTSKGRCMAIVQGTKETGLIRVRAISDSGSSDWAQIIVK